MKSFFLVAALSAIGAHAASNSTVVCPDCPPPTSTDDIVTREPIPTTSCDAPELTTVPASTTSTVFTTKVYTITSCPPTVTNCPVGQKTTEIISLYTTVCPVTATGGPMPPASSMPAPASSMPAASMPAAGGMTSMVTANMPVPTGSNNGTVPVTGAANALAGSFGAVAFAAAAAYLL